jgi:hypothetical protein
LHIKRLLCVLFSATAVRIGVLKANMFEGDKAGAFPKFKAKATVQAHMFTSRQITSWMCTLFAFALQAATVRALGKPLLAVFERHMTQGDLMHSRIQLALKLSVRVEELLDQPNASHRLPSEVASEIRTSVDSMLSLVSAIGVTYQAAGRSLFNYTIKNHYLQHIALRICRMTPRASWCYSGENFMNIMKRIVAASVKGTSGVKVVNKTTEKFVAGMAISIYGVDALQM